MTSAKSLCARVHSRGGSRARLSSGNGLRQAETSEETFLKQINKIYS